MKQQPPCNMPLPRTSHSAGRRNLKVTKVNVHMSWVRTAQPRRVVGPQRVSLANWNRKSVGVCVCVLSKQRRKTKRCSVKRATKRADSEQDRRLHNRQRLPNRQSPHECPTQHIVHAFQLASACDPFSMCVCLYVHLKLKPAFCLQ